LSKKQFGGNLKEHSSVNNTSEQKKSLQLGMSIGEKCQVGFAVCPNHPVTVVDGGYLFAIMFPIEPVFIAVILCSLVSSSSDLEP